MSTAAEFLAQEAALRAQGERELERLTASQRLPRPEHGNALHRPSDADRDRELDRRHERRMQADTAAYIEFMERR